jgi:hypothetical protein
MCDEAHVRIEELEGPEIEEVKKVPTKDGFEETWKIITRRSRNWQVYELDVDISFPACTPEEVRGAAILKRHKELVSMSLRGLDEVCRGELEARKRDRA